MTDQAGNLAKATKLLGSLAAAGSTGATVAELSKACGVARPSAHRILGKLEDVGWVQKDIVSRKFQLGPELAVLGFAAMQKFPLESLSLPYMEELSRRTGQTISLMRRIGDEAVCVSRVEGAGHIRALLLEVGSRWPLGKGAAGMAMLAALPETEASAILLRNEPRFETETLGELESRLVETRKTGVARHRGLVLPGVSGLAAPIFDATGGVIASVSVAYVEDWMDSDALEACLTGIPKLAADITKRLREGT